MVVPVKKTTTVIVVWMTLLFVIGGALLIPLGVANPYWWYESVPPDSSTNPPIISVVSPENNSVISEDNLVLSFQVKTGKSKRALDTLLFFVDYTTDWEHNNSDHFAPWSKKLFSHEINLTKIPEGTHSISITATELGTYPSATKFVIESAQKIYFTIDPNAQTDQIPEFPAWIVLLLFLTATLVVTVYKKKLPKPAG